MNSAINKPGNKNLAGRKRVRESFFSARQNRFAARLVFRPRVALAQNLVRA